MIRDRVVNSARSFFMDLFRDLEKSFLNVDKDLTTIYTRGRIMKCENCGSESNPFSRNKSCCMICEVAIANKKSEEKYSKRLEASNIYYHKNRESILEKRKTNEKTKEYNREYKRRNKDRIIEYNKEYINENRDIISLKRKDYRQVNKEKIREYERNRLKENKLARIAKRLRGRISDFIKSSGYKKSQRLVQYLGCSLDVLKSHLEAQFVDGMSWDNLGEKWHIDHSLSLSSGFDINKVYELCHYKNLKPLFKEDNHEKNRNSDICWQKLQRDRHLEEDMSSGFPLDPDLGLFVFSIEELSLEHREFIKRYEWLGTIGFNVKWCFTARYDGLLGGVVLLSEPNSYQFEKNLECLIQRGACAGWTPKNLGSKLVMFSCKWMVNNTSKRIFVAYSDPEAGEIGTIYQACNFDFLGFGYGDAYNYRLPNGNLVNSRYFSRTSSMKKLAKKIGLIWLPSWCKPNGFLNTKEVPRDILSALYNKAREERDKCPRIKKRSKGKYVLLLKKNKREKIEKKWISKEYPKRRVYGKTEGD